MELPTRLEYNLKIKIGEIIFHYMINYSMNLYKNSYPLEFLK